MKNSTIILLLYIAVLLSGCTMSGLNWDLPKIAEIETVKPDNILDATARCGGNITNDGGSAVQERGVCYGTTAKPTIDSSKVICGDGKGSFEAIVADLKASTVYYIRAYATTSAGTVYGSEFVFTTLNLASLTTGMVQSVTLTTAICSGIVLNDGGSTLTERGICYHTSKSPTIANHTVKSAAELGEFSVSLSELTTNTTYFVRAYATNVIGTSYGNEVSFTTTSIPTLSTAAISLITQTSAKSGGVVSNSGSSTVLQRGICFDTIPHPQVTGFVVESGTGSGTYTSSMTGLQPGKTYYVRSYATNSSGTAYGNELSFSTNPVLLPTLSTASVTSITLYAAISGGNVTNNGGASVTSKGICFGLTPAPAIDGNVVEKGSGTGSFTADITGLNPGVTYYVRAYATNSAGTAYGNEITFATKPVLIPTLTTTAVSSVAYYAAISGGNVTNDGGAAVTARGICYTTSPIPTIAGSLVEKGSGTGSFTADLTGLIPGTTYHLRAYATNSAGTAYGNEITFVTKAILIPTLSTTTVSSLLLTSAISGGNVTYDGGAIVSSKGICFSTTPLPTIAENVVEKGSGTGTFTADLTGLIPGTTYHLRAYATNIAGTAYGNEITFVTKPILIPTISTATISSILLTSAISGGNVTNDGGAPVTLRGICYSTTISPTIAGNIVAKGSGTGIYTADLTGLNPGTTYHLRAFAMNIAGTAYGNEIIFTTIPILIPTLTTTAVSSVAFSTAVSGGNVTSDGNAAVTVRGICYSTSPVPTIAGNIIGKGSGTGSFTADLTGLIPGTTYHLRAYATNSAGTAYGNEITFATKAILIPTLSTTAASSILITSAVSGGNVTGDGGAAVISRGICFGTTRNPTVSGNLVESGSGTGIFTLGLTGLSARTTYYIRAFATNSAGTAYGNEVNFTTAPVFTIGQIYQGGIIFYLDETYVHGLIAAPSDQSVNAVWGCAGTSMVNSQGTALGTGLANTTSILSGCLTGGIAARLCGDLTISGYTDWYLPSTDELNLMYLKLKLQNLGGFANANYWSSSEFSDTSSYLQLFSNGTINQAFKSTASRVRAIRSF